MTLEETQKEKDLLLKDLCARLPYGVRYRHFAWDDERGEECIAAQIYSINSDGYVKNCYDDETVYIDNVQPYLFPISSMTEEMLEELNANGLFKYRDTIANVFHLESKNGISEEIYTYIDIEDISKLIEFFHSYHIDYRGLLEKGLAIDATGLNIY